MAGAVIRRGDIVVMALSGDYGKPRPALVVQSDLFSNLPSVALCPLTSLLRPDADLLRIGIEPSPHTGLRQQSQVTIDKITTVPLAKIAAVIGRADERLMTHVNRALALFLDVV